MHAECSKEPHRDGSRIFEVMYIAQSVNTIFRSVGFHKIRMPKDETSEAAENNGHLAPWMMEETPMNVCIH